VKRLLLVALFLEIGFLLVVMPWSAFWDRNYFVQSLPVVAVLLTNNFVRGGVTGLGLVNLYLGFSELVRALSARAGSSSLGASSISPRD
jgi:hypothetical protein